jgi:hypothetical protein
MPLPPWLPDFVRSAMAKQARDQVWSAQELQEAGGLLLFATIGCEAYLRPDGSVWYREDKSLPNEPERYEWREGQGNDRWAGIVLGSRRMPELGALLPARPANTPACSRCHGRGEILAGRQYDDQERGIVCPDCGALGWVFSGAA